MVNVATLVATTAMNNAGNGHHLPPLSTESISSMVGWISIWVWVCVYSPYVSFLLGKFAHFPPFPSFFSFDVVFLTHFSAYSFYQSITGKLSIKKWRRTFDHFCCNLVSR